MIYHFGFRVKRVHTAFIWQGVGTRKFKGHSFTLLIMPCHFRAEYFPWYITSSLKHVSLSTNSIVFAFSRILKQSNVNPKLVLQHAVFTAVIYCTSSMKYLWLLSTNPRHYGFASMICDTWKVCLHLCEMIIKMSHNLLCYCKHHYILWGQCYINRRSSVSQTS